MFVDRDENGKVIGVYALSQRDGQEELLDDHADIEAFHADPVPQQVSAGQMLQALNELGLLATVDAAVAQADAFAQRLWARAPNFPRNDPMVIAIGTAIGKTSQELDDLFRLAGTK